MTICWSKTAQLQQSGIVRTDFTNCPISTGTLASLKNKNLRTVLCICGLFGGDFNLKNRVKIAKLTVHHY